MVWKYEKFSGDAAIYAFCPICGFYHCPSGFNEKMKPEIRYEYNYCPICGEYLHDDNFEDGAMVIWNERKIEELYNEEN